MLTNGIYFCTSKSNTTRVEGAITPSQHGNTASPRIDGDVVAMGPCVWVPVDHHISLSYIFQSKNIYGEKKKM